jgi:hypothetical protein
MTIFLPGSPDCARRRLLCWRSLTDQRSSPKSVRLHLAGSYVSELRAERYHVPFMIDRDAEIKDEWFRLPSYPDQIFGLDIYTAVIEDGVRTPAQFRSWLAERGLPV